MSKSKKSLLGVFLSIEFAVILLAPFLELYSFRNVGYQQEIVTGLHSSSDNIKVWQHSGGLSFLIEIKEGTEEETLSEELSFLPINKVEQFVADKVVGYTQKEINWEYCVSQIPLYLKFCTLKIPF